MQGRVSVTHSYNSCLCYNMSNPLSQIFFFAFNAFVLGVFVGSFLDFK